MNYAHTQADILLLKGLGDQICMEKLTLYLEGVVNT